jgi:hypothetical protein
MHKSFWTCIRQPFLKFSSLSKGVVMGLKTSFSWFSSTSSFRPDSFVFPLSGLLVVTFHNVLGPVV